MISHDLLVKYAKLAVVVGANVQKDQLVVIRATTETKELVREIAEQAYLVGAKQVDVVWSDDYVARSGLTHRSIEHLSVVPKWIVNRYQHYVEEGAAFISVISPIPELNASVDSKKIQTATSASAKALSFFRTHTMGNKSQWTIVAVPNKVWAEKVFKDLTGELAITKLWDAILSACRVTKDTDPVTEWTNHNRFLSINNDKLNQNNFYSLHFKNSLGTDLVVGLADDHSWAGGGEVSLNGVYFNPNLPTEESFTMPHKHRVNGTVYSSKPLNYAGKIIDEFWLEFKDGKVVNFDAKKEKESLANLLNSDAGSSYIGEIALVNFDSAISNTNILFLTTLFDENASCHIALGAAYPMNIAGGINMELSELEKRGFNKSDEHCDFMFGTSDLEITGIKHDQSKVTVFKNGNYVI